MSTIIDVLLPALAIAVFAYGAGLPLLGVLVLAGVVGGVLGWRHERRRIAEQTRSAVMASVMDVQNNFLNNMLYFRTRAEAEGTVTPADLKQMDSVIRETQSKLAELADADLEETRNLGGITVLKKPRAKLAG